MEQAQIWMKKAQCFLQGLSPDYFFPKGDGGRRKMRPGTDSRQSRQDKEIEIAKFCFRSSCAVRQDCLDYALSHNIQEGVWGGKTSDERKAMTKTSSVGE